MNKGIIYFTEESLEEFWDAPFADPTEMIWDEEQRCITLSYRDGSSVQIPWYDIEERVGSPLPPPSKISIENSRDTLCVLIRSEEDHQHLRPHSGAELVHVIGTISSDGFIEGR